MSTRLRQVRAYLLKIEHLFYRLATALAIIFAVFAVYQAYHAITLGGTFSSFFNSLCHPVWITIFGLYILIKIVIETAITFTKKSD